MRAFKLGRPPRLLVGCLGVMSVLAGVLVLAGPASAHPREWSGVPSPSTGSLNGVSCVRAERCMAVGGFSPEKAEALAESWNGRAWSSVPTPVLTGGDAGPPEVSLNGVSCVSARSCVAAGGQNLHFPGTHCCERTLIETWSGREWSVVPSANMHESQLADVSCVSSRFCVAVGTGWLGAGPGKTLVESWNGTEWSVVPSPNPGLGGQLYGVSCGSSKFCVAVGVGVTERLPVLALVESWNGTEWSVGPSLSAGWLNSVSCVSAKRCVAVGRAASGTLVESWNGSVWSVLESPNPEGSGRPELNGVSCVSAGSCAAVGSDSTEGGPSQTLVETSKGGKWSIVPSANSASGQTRLDGVSCASTESCFAVGNQDSVQTLVESGGI